MKLAKTLAIVACAGLLSVCGMGSTHHAYAQEAEEGAWNAAGAGSADESSPEAKKPPLDIGGCWDGTAEDKGDGLGSAFFDFVQDGTKLESSSPSEADVYWPDNTYAYGPISGSVSSTGFKFKGSAGTGCPFHGSGKGSDTLLTGKITFGGQCAKFLKHVTFSISPGPC